MKSSGKWISAAVVFLAAASGLAQERGPAGVSTRPAAQTATPGEKRTNPADGAEMVWIPPGEFKMGGRL